MNPQARFAKTDKGLDEIRNRTHKLEARSRQVLVLVDGGKAASELLSIAASQEVLLALLKEGFIREVSAAEPPAADAPVSDEMRQKVYAAKAAMRRYIKMAAVEVKALGKAVDDIKGPADVNVAMREIKRVFDGNGFGEAFANLSREVAAL